MTPRHENQSSSLPAPAASGALSDTLEGLAAASHVEPFDFSKPRELLPGDLRRLRSQHDRLCETLSASFTQLFNTPCRLAVEDISLVTCGWLGRSWPDSALAVLFRAEPLRGAGLLQISQPLARAMLDVMKGQTPQCGAAPAGISVLDKALFEDATRLVLDEWCAAWNHSAPLKAQILTVENDGRFVEIGSKDALALTVKASLAFAGFSGTILIAIPHGSVKKMIVSRRKSGMDAAEKPSAIPAQANGGKIAENNPLLDDMPVSVTARWLGLEMSAREIVNLKVGGILKLAQGTASSAEILLGEVPRFLGRPGTLGGDWAVELTQKVNP